ncbi:uncharacterized protein LOC133302838 [Gastrolobium bilobum]|uniref:uncharacterized protein LOC133302838 n=1 Tax=Gastrolobium bilobum TaxID=150636 RepID=UPI002AB181AF|nr:uncharacterized protein LOC133302838 [Gastrolobium bilobum]
MGRASDEGSKGEEVICFNCGKEGHYASDCSSPVARTTTVQAAPLQMVPVPLTATPIVPSVTGRVYTLDRQQSNKTPNLVRGTVSTGGCDVDVLFDSGTMHSFITDPIAAGLKLPISMLSPSLRVTAVTGEK